MGSKRIKWTPEKVIEEIKKLDASGEGLYVRNVTEVNLALLKAGKRYFGSWETAITSAGFDYEEVKQRGKREGSQKISAGRQKYYNSPEYLKKQKREATQSLQQLHRENPYLTYSFLYENHNALLSMLYKHYNSIDEAMIAAGIDYAEIKKETSRRRWTDESIKKEILALIEKGEPLNASYIIDNHRQLYRACVEYLGSWGSALDMVGVDYSEIKELKRQETTENSTLYTKAYVLGKLMEIKEKGLPLSKKTINEHKRSLEDACYNRFGSIKKAIEAAGYSYEEELKEAEQLWLIRQREVQMKWTREAVIEEIKRLYEQRVPMNKSHLQSYNQSLYDGAMNRFGSWGDAIEAAGIDYESIREDSRDASYCGRLFEDLLDKLLVEIGISYEKYNHKTYNPDYTLNNNVWMDAKLSQWTVYASKTIDRYKEHCRYLTIIYMRGKRGEISDEVIQSNVRLISVHKLIKQLPKHREKCYIIEINEIERYLNKIEDWQ
ncbi:hypothetical protein IMZ31_05325 [Pontibacillus sp. ALD_SL1]|uniref:homing endonuclease associated repeat-containing protein n=1 Tax=Pontibacillus sp. ALD_SL1 TaxID=2777185 RepID=UPI001A95F950|nr:hypothetical protein [Pontibacillus sp. ALD_SL1]QST00993.1 hypothetical protein IMZ31_05325 [Pontibacillus sp. ALD_SL1]